MSWLVSEWVGEQKKVGERVSERDSVGGAMSPSREARDTSEDNHGVKSLA